MSSKSVISLQDLGKCYQVYEKPRDRLLQMLARGRKQYYREFWALRGISMQIVQGDVVGIIGSNGAGKSTLLQLVCGTLNPTHGEVSVAGRVAALLELGAGFNPEFSGRENVYLSAALSGLNKHEINASIEDIIEFSGIRDFIDQPVKTYSSGMYIRLAFSVAINVDPDILVIDEALSVGDGAFARKSFDRIMKLKNAGRTVLFCSHSLYQVEAICNRVLWLKQGKVQMIGNPADVVMAYNDDLHGGMNDPDSTAAETESPVKIEEASACPEGTAAIVKVLVAGDGVEGKELQLKSMQSSVSVVVQFASDPTLPTPTVAVGFVLPEGKVVAGTSTYVDDVVIQRATDGTGSVRIIYPQLPFLKGQYMVFVYLMCERGVHVYDYSHQCAMITVGQSTLEQGIVALEHHWDSPPW